MVDTEMVIQVNDIKKYYPIRQSLFSKGYESPWLKAVNGVSFGLKKGGTLGIAGESGCGKTTTGRMLLKLTDITDGQYLFNGHDISHLRNRQEIKKFRREAQLVFQNPFEALNPRFTVYRSLLEPLIIHGIGTKAERADRIRAVLERVNLRPATDFFDKYPHQLSGGQLQRIVIARALIVEPVFIVADEPVSMLDVSVRAGVLNLLREVTAGMGLTALYISHDLSLIQYLCEQTAIMYLGQIVEIGPSNQVLENPRHPYTQALVSAIPSLDPNAKEPEVLIKGNVLSPIDLPDGCLFQNRCPYAEQVCQAKQPDLAGIGSDHSVRCHKVVPATISHQEAAPYLAAHS